MLDVFNLIQLRITLHKYRSLNNFLYRKLRLNRILYFLAGFKLKKLAAKCRSFDEYIDLIKSFDFSFFNFTSPIIIWAFQKKSEITKFCNILVKKRPKIVLEIGTGNGGTLLLLTRLSAPDASIFSIDKGRDFRKYNRGIFYKSFLTNKQKLHYFRKGSHLQSTLRDIKKDLKDNKIDVLFIDGDHKYRGVKRDFEMYGPLVKKNGIIAFHDIVLTPPRRFPVGEVNKFWNEIKENYEYKELVEDWNQKWGGIGVIKKQ